MEAPPQGGRRLAASTVRGFVWMVAQTLGNKVVGTITQVVLGWLLLPAEFGALGLALTVTAVLAILQHAGLGDVLIQRRDAFQQWANPTFWLALTLGAVSALAMIAVAPTAAAIYEAPRLVYIIAVLALATPLQALSIVPRARLQADLRFGTLSTVGMVINVLLNVTTIALAATGFGVMSLVIPRPLVAGVEAAILWAVAGRCGVQPSPEVRRWGSILPTSAMLLVISAMMAYTNQVDYFALGLFHDEATVGVYFFAFNISTQVLVLTTINLASVLLPAFAHLADDPRTQRLAFVRSTRVLVAGAGFLCLLQAAAADSLITLFFGDRWASAVPVIQILSLGWAVRMAVGPSNSLLKARNELGLLSRTYALHAALATAAALSGAWWGGSVAVATGIAVTLAITGPVQIGATLVRLGGRWRELGAIYSPMLAAAPAVSAGVLAGWAARPAHPIVELAAVITVATATYLPLIRKVDPELWSLALGQLRRARPGAAA